MRIFKSFSVFALCVVGATAISAHAKPKQADAVTLVNSTALAETLRDIRIEGNQRIDPETVRSYIPLATGQVLTQDKIDGTIKALYATGLFADVKLVEQGQRLVVQVKENPLINTITFEGNKAYKDDALKAEMQLRPRAVYTRSKVQEDTQRLQELYRRSGRFAAEVEPKIVPLDQNRVNLVYEITEGEKTFVQRITFVNNAAFDDGALRTVIRTKEKAWYRLLTSDDTYDQDRLAYDEELLRQHYLENGFLDFKVVSRVAELSPDKKGFFITFKVEEGKQYTLGAVTIASTLKNVNGADLQEFVTVKPEDVFNMKRVQNIVDSLTEQLGNRGYAFVDVRPDIQRRDGAQAADGNLLVDLIFRIKEAPKVYVERINITGNVRTEDHVIRREFKLVEGDAFNTARLQESERNLKNLGFFEKSDVKVNQGSSPDKTIIDVNVLEQSTGELSFGAGFSSAESLLGDVRLRERNFLGRGQDVKISATLSGRRREFDVGYTEPYFLGRKVSAGLDLFNATTDYQQSSSYDEQRTGGAVTFGFPISEYLTESVSYGLKTVKISNVSNTASSYIREQKGTATTSSVGQELLYDRRDNRIEPSRGYYVRLSNDFAGVGGDVNYLRTRLGTGYYIPLAEEDWVLSMRAETGYIFGIGEDVRINDRFFVGGNSLRGFKIGGIGPRDLNTRDALGGNRFTTASTEVRFPLGLPSELGLSGRTFADAGTLSSLDKTGAGIADEADFRASLGVGLSWSSPFGPVKLDFGQAVLKKSYDEKEIFRFSFGTQF
jgi:outer membrane protein insertion porin family